jgi:hypothetical protein
MTGGRNRRAASGNIKFHSVNTEQIPIEPGPYCMSFAFDPQTLERSLDAVGLVHPPLLEEGRDGFLVVTGSRRIAAARALLWDKIPCMVIQRANITPLECLNINLYDNVCSRAVNEIEKAMILSRLRPFVSLREILNRYMPLLGLPSNEASFLLYLRFVDDLVQDAQESFAKGQLCLKAAKMLVELGRASQKAIFHIIEKIKLNFNEQIQFIEYIIDLCKIDGVEIPDYLEEIMKQNALCDPNMNNPQKAKALMRFLRMKRFPNLSKSERKFKTRVAQLDLPKGVTINHSPYFEDTDYRLQIIFSNGQALKGLLKALSTKNFEFIGDPWLPGTK